MDQQKNNKKIVAIVPAYNEQERIEDVISVLVSYGRFSDIIVVDDGSTDDTAKIVAQYPVTFLQNKMNSGKGYSMNKGVQHTDAEYIFFMDADVSGMTHDILSQIISPVVDGQTEMFIGMRNRKIYYLRYLLWFVPLLGGERALTRTLWEEVPAFYKNRFRIEAGLNFYAQHYGKGFEFGVFEGLTQVIKEKKYGFWKGFLGRIKMSYEVMSAQYRLHVVDMPTFLKKKRKLALWALQSIVGMIIGMVFLVAAYVGPKKFIIMFFHEELLEDPNAYVVHFLFRGAENITVGLVALIGFLLFVLNASTLMYTGRHLLHFISGLLYKREVYKHD